MTVTVPALSSPQASAGYEGSTFEWTTSDTTRRRISSSSASRSVVAVAAPEPSTVGSVSGNRPSPGCRSGHSPERGVLAGRGSSGLNSLVDDTTPDVWGQLARRYRAMPPWQKVAIVRELNRRTTELALSDIRAKHPDATERELRLRLASRRMDPEVLRQQFGWDVREQGY